MLVRSRAPVRLGLGGGGSDISPFCDRYGGHVLNATIDLYAHCFLQPTADGQVEFCALDHGYVFSSAAEAWFEPIGDLQLHKGVYNRVVQLFHGGRALSVRVASYTEVPIGSG